MVSESGVFDPCQALVQEVLADLRPTDFVFVEIPVAKGCREWEDLLRLFEGSLEVVLPAAELEMEEPVLQPLEGLVPLVFQSLLWRTLSAPLPHKQKGNVPKAPQCPMEAVRLSR